MKKKHIKVCDVKSAKLYLHGVVTCWVKFGNSHKKIIKAIKILLNHDKETF